MKLGAARAKAPAAWRLLDTTVDPQKVAFAYALNRNKLRRARRREGRFVLRTNLCGRDPAEPWRCDIQLVEVEAAFKTLKDDLKLRPIRHQLESRVEALNLRGLPRLLPTCHAARQAQADGRRPHPARRPPDPVRGSPAYKCSTSTSQPQTAER